MQGRKLFNTMGSFFQSFSSKNNDDASEKEKEQKQNPLEEEAYKKAIATALAQAKAIGPRSYQLVNTHSEDDFCLMAIGCEGAEGEDPEKVAQLMNKIVEQGLITNPQGQSLIPDVIYVAGDNFYPIGVSRPDDPRFKKQFKDRYHNTDLEWLNKICLRVALGNHDAGREFWKNGQRKFMDTPMGKELEVNQVAHSMLENGYDLYNQNQFDVQAETQSPFHMPNFFYEDYDDQDGVHIIAANSNSYIKSFLKNLRKEVNDKANEIKPNSQAAWIKAKYQAAKGEGKKVILLQHHPLFCTGKRAYSYGWDGHHYLDGWVKKADLVAQLLPAFKQAKKELAAIKGKESDNEDACRIEYLRLKNLLRNILNTKNDSELKYIDGLPELSEHYRPTAYLPKPLPESVDYNYLYREFLLYHEEIIPDIAIVAHEHFLDLSYHDIVVSGINHTICQIKTGGAGSRKELQEKLFFANPENEACYFRKTGVFALHWNKKNPDLIYIHVFTVDGDHLIFTHENKEPLTYRSTNDSIPSSEETSLFPKLRECVLKACDAYENFLDGQQKHPINTGTYHGQFFSRYSTKGNLTHGENELLCMHEVKNGFNRPDSLDFTTAIVFLWEQIGKIKYPNSKNSFLHYLNVELNSALNKSLNELYETCLVEQSLPEGSSSLNLSG